MNSSAQFERDLEQWLLAEAPATAPAGFHAAVMDRARGLRQRPGWTTSRPVRLLGRRRGMTLLAAAAVAVGGALAAGSGVLRLPAVVTPVPGPSDEADATAPPSASPITVAGPGGVWIAAGPMVTPRSYQSGVRLLDGRVLAVGGGSATGDPLTSAELYDPATGTWAATGSMPDVNTIPAVLLHDGTVLVGNAVYDPGSGTWTETGPMVDHVGGGATVTVLRDGRVLVTKYSGAQLYDPESGSWAATGDLNVVRENAAATLLADGKVLVAGGLVWDMPPDSREGTQAVADSAEVYDPATGSWTAIANMPSPAGLTATLLRDGKVLVAGTNGDGGVAEIYDPATGTWSELSVRPGATFNTAVLLSDGTVLLTDTRRDCVAVDLLDPLTGSWASAPSLPYCGLSSFTPLLDGTVLVTGRGAPYGAAALYVPAGVPVPNLPAFPTPAPPLFSSPTPIPIPTPRPTLFPAAAGPVPSNALRWTVTVDNRSAEPATLFVAVLEDDGTLRLVGSATPNVVPAGTIMEVTFLFPADGGEIYVNPRPGDGGSLVNETDIGIPGKIVISATGGAGWLSP